MKRKAAEVRPHLGVEAEKRRERTEKGRKKGVKGKFNTNEELI